MGYEREFSGFPLPAIPAGWTDATDSGDAMPRFTIGRLCVWIDWPNPADSDFPESRSNGTRKRFLICEMQGEDFGPTLLESDEWESVLSFTLLNS